MANEHGLFWNSQNGDRVYDANDFSEWLKKFYTTGVFNGDLEVTAAGGMTVSVSSGYVNIEGKVKFFSTPTTLTLATASGTYGRIDTVVAECNYTDREIKLKVVTGTYNTSPTATAPVRTAAAYQLVLAQIDVAAGAAEITQKNIADKRMDSNVCGLVTGTVSQIDFSTVKAQFDSWFDDVKGTLDTDAAGNLKNQIDAINDKIGTTDISSIGDGTETGAISANASNISQTQAAITALNSGLSDKLNASDETFRSFDTSTYSNNANWACLTGLYKTDPNTVGASDYGVLVVFAMPYPSGGFNGKNWVHQLWLTNNNYVQHRYSVNKTDGSGWSAWTAL